MLHDRFAHVFLTRSSKSANQQFSSSAIQLKTKDKLIAAE
jgi:hypothetical protein